MGRRAELGFSQIRLASNAGVSENPGSRAAQGPFQTKEPIVRRENGRGKHISNIWQIQRGASGGTLTASMNGARNIMITDESGWTARISTYNVYQSYGVIQVVDKVLLPKM